MNTKTNGFIKYIFILALFMVACSERPVIPTPVLPTATSAVAQIANTVPAPATATTAPTLTPFPTETATPTSEPTTTPTATATPTATPFPQQIENDTAEMVLIEEGFFKMGDAAEDLLTECESFRQGCQQEWFVPSEPAHTLHIDNFYIDVYEVTNEAYLDFMVDLGTHEAACYGQDCLNLEESAIELLDGVGYDVATDLLDHPAAGVSWYGAQAFCDWRGARLPTEAEWEKAASWDPEEKDKYRYPWGNVFDETAVNFCDQNCSEVQANAQVDDGAAFTAPVGSYEAGRSAAGAFDMAGNVWEWVADWYDSAFYSESATVNPIGPEQGAEKVVRGGSWFDTGNFTSSVIRFPAPPDATGNSIGFRCAWSPTHNPIEGMIAALEEGVVETAVLAITSPADGAEIATDEAITVAGTGTAGATIELLNGETVLDTAVVAEDGTWEFILQPDEESYALSVRLGEETSTVVNITVADTVVAEAVTPTPTPTEVAPTPTTVAPTPTTAPSQPTPTPGSSGNVDCNSQPGIDQGSTYVMGICDTLSGVATRFGYTLAELLAANPQISNPNNVQAGQVINLPNRGGGGSSSDPTNTPQPPAPTATPDDPGLNG